MASATAATSSRWQTRGWYDGAAAFSRGSFPQKTPIFSMSCSAGFIANSCFTPFHTGPRNSTESAASWQHLVVGQHLKAALRRALRRLADKTLGERVAYKAEAQQGPRLGGGAGCLTEGASLFLGDQT